MNHKTKLLTCAYLDEYTQFQGWGFQGVHHLDIVAKTIHPQGTGSGVTKRDLLYFVKNRSGINEPGEN